MQMTVKGVPQHRLNNHDQRACQPLFALSFTRPIVALVRTGGRTSSLGLAISGLAVEAVTSKGIIQQVWGFNESTKGIDCSALLSFFS